MPNPVLLRLMEERTAQVDFIDGVLSRVESESRDLVDAEKANLSAARERIAAIDAQREPLESFEQLRAVSEESTRLVYAGRSSGGGELERRPASGPAAQTYGSAGEFVVDLIRARGYPGQQIEPDPAARQRVEAALGRSMMSVEGRAVATQTTADTPGLLPKPIIGEVLHQLDGARPFVTSIGVRSMAGTPGKSFSRPYISQHTDVGQQAQEKTELASRALKILSLDLDKKTFGGVVNVSRQDIDWTSPSAWDILLNDLQNVYAAETDDAASAALATAVVQAVPVAGDSLDEITTALYTAAALAATGNGTQRASALRLPNMIWTSVDMWAVLGAALSSARASAPGFVDASASPTNFAGDIYGLPRIVVPGFPPSTIIVGRSNLTEFYEERIGVLSAVEPAILGVEVAYGGYAAYGTVDPTAFAKVTGLTPPAAQAAAASNGNGNGNGSNGNGSRSSSGASGR